MEITRRQLFWTITWANVTAYVLLGVILLFSSACISAFVYRIGGGV
jgi:hypothetical protein